MTAPILLTKLRRISTPKGDVLHCLKSTDSGFAGFGEAYFSMVLPNDTKGWKKHNRMTLNLAVVVGAVRFLVRDPSPPYPQIFDIVLSPDEEDLYQRLTIPPGYWIAFRGVSPTESMLVNIASIPHDPNEADTLPLSTFCIADENQR
jgi:dTDP-4-dehydrorhamnose 3,5-epimerase